MSINRSKRANFTTKQKDALVATFRLSPYVTAVERSQLADDLSVSADQVGNWFKNERARVWREMEKASGTPVRTCYPRKRRIADQLPVKLERKPPSPLTIMSSDAESQIYSDDDEPLTRLQIVTRNESEGHVAPRSNSPSFTNTSG